MTTRTTLAACLAAPLALAPTATAQCALDVLAGAEPYGSLGRAIAVGPDALVVAGGTADELARFRFYGWSGESWALEHSLDLDLSDNPCKCFPLEVDLDGDMALVYSLDDTYPRTYRRVGQSWIGAGFVPLIDWQPRLAQERVAGLVHPWKMEFTALEDGLWVHKHKQSIWLEPATGPWTYDFDADVMAYGFHEEGGEGQLTIYEFDGTEWNEAASFVDAAPALTGERIRVQDGRVLVAHGGAFRLFDKSSGTWQPGATLVPADLTPADRPAFELEGQRAAFGAPAAAGLANVAAVYMEEEAGEWTVVSVVEPHGVAAESAFGYAVAVSAEWLVVGAPGTFFDEGASHVFTLAEAGADLDGCPNRISVGAAEKQTLALNAGPEWAGATYVLVGTFSGTAPGIDLGSVHLALNPDAYFLHTIVSPGVPLEGSLGSLSATGQATAAFQVPAAPPAWLVGVELHHAYVLLEAGAAVYASASVPLTFEP